MKEYSSISMPIITEKSSNQQAGGQYTFLLASNKITKIDVKKAVKTIYGADVESVRIINCPKKTRSLGKNIIKKRKPYKKALVTLKGKSTIDPNKIKESKK